MHRGYRPMLCVEVLEARLALSASPAPAAEPPTGLIAVEVGPEPVAVGTDENGEVIYMISMPPSEKCMCRVCIGTWDGPPRSSVTAEAQAIPAVDAPGSPEVGVVLAERAVVMADRTGTPDVIVEAATAPVGYPVALPPVTTSPTWELPETLTPDSPRDVIRDAAADQLAVPAADGDAEPVAELVAPAADETEADPLVLGA